MTPKPNKRGRPRKSSIKTPTEDEVSAFFDNLPVAKVNELEIDPTFFPKPISDE
jgi:hypothetical protein